MAHIAGKSGNVYVASAIIDDCEDAWASGTHGTASLNTDRDYIKVGDGSCKVVLSSVEDDDVVAYEAIAAGATNYSTYTHVLCWAYCSGTTAAADFRLCLDKDAGAPASPETLLDLPALTAATWKYCHCAEVTGSELDNSTAAVTVGLEMNANAQDVTIYLDDIRAAKNIAGIRSWTIDYTTDALDTTDFADSGVRAYIAGCSNWSGSFEGFKDGAPLAIGSQYGVELAESATTTQMWLGNAVITGIHINTSHDGIVSYTYDFQGTGVLTIASA